jgi:uracil-DNA glycosylase family 4
MPLESDQNLLLDAAISHLESLKRQGIRYIDIDQQLLRELTTTQPAPRPAAVFPAPAPAPQPSAAPSARPVSPSPAIAVRPARPAVRPTAPPPEPSIRPLTREQKEAAFAALRDQALKCVLCSHLAASRRNVVFGVGDIHARLMFVGEAPGAEEDAQGEPFVGAAGQLLTKIIQAMGLSRAGVYIGNVLKCRPDTPGQSYGNRKPTPEEMGTCLPYLQEQIRIIQPTVIVALGATAMEGLFGKAPVYITKLRGKWQDFQGIPVMPTYHPSYVLRNQSPVTKRETWEDMLAAMERLDLPISEKQRGYFLKG